MGFLKYQIHRRRKTEAMLFNQQLGRIKGAITFHKVLVQKLR